MPETSAPLSLLAGLREPLDHAGRLEGNLPCRCCAYNLRGHAPDANCPECGSPVALSLRYFLRYSSARWVRALAGGADALCLAVLLAGVAWLGAGAAGFLPGPVLPWAFVFAWAALGVLGSLLLAVVGLWRITSPERERRAGPGRRAFARSHRRPGGWVRWPLRCAPPAMLLILSGWGAAAAAIPVTRPFAELFGLGLAALGGLLTLALLCWHLRTLLRRVPEPRLVRLASVAFAAVLATLLLLAAGVGVLAVHVAAARGLTFRGGEVRWSLGAVATTAGSPNPHDLAIASVESEVLPGAAAGSPQQPGAVTVWTTNTLFLPRLVVAAAAIPPLVAVLTTATLLILARRAIRSAVADAAAGR